MLCSIVPLQIYVLPRCTVCVVYKCMTQKYIFYIPSWIIVVGKKSYFHPSLHLKNIMYLFIYYIGLDERFVGQGRSHGLVSVLLCLIVMYCVCTEGGAWFTPVTVGVRCRIRPPPPVCGSTHTDLHPDWVQHVFPILSLAPLGFQFLMISQLKYLQDLCFITVLLRPEVKWRRLRGRKWENKSVKMRFRCLKHLIESLNAAFHDGVVTLF